MPIQAPTPSPRGLSHWLIFVLGIVLLTTACTPIPTSAPEDEGAATQADASPDDAATDEAPTPCDDATAQWGYSADSGPERWASLSPCFALCEAGKAQSPVDIVPGSVSSLPPLRFNYQEGPLRVANTGQVVQFALGGKGSLDFGEMTFGLRRVDVRSPSEHTLRGQEYPMELQFVHSSRESLAVVSVFVEAGEDHPVLASLWEHRPQDIADMDTIEGVLWQPSELLPVNSGTHRYAGSLTTPPCSENVHWIVMDESITLSQEKIAAFRAIYDGNRRPVQALGDRNVSSGS